MADLNIPNKKESPQKFDLSPSSSRVSMSLNATYQIEAMIDALVKVVLDADESLRAPVQYLGARIRELNTIIMSALGDELAAEPELRARLYGRAAGAAHGKEVAHG